MNIDHSIALVHSSVVCHSIWMGLRYNSDNRMGDSEDHSME